MSFNNSGLTRSTYTPNVSSNISSIPAAPAQAPRNLALNAPMIERVYKARPGCSACGKKVA